MIGTFARALTSALGLSLLAAPAVASSLGERVASVRAAAEKAGGSLELPTVDSSRGTEALGDGPLVTVTRQPGPVGKELAGVYVDEKRVGHLGALVGPLSVGKELGDALAVPLAKGQERVTLAIDATHQARGIMMSLHWFEWPGMYAFRDVGIVVKTPVGLRRVVLKARTPSLSRPDQLRAFVRVEADRSVMVFTGVGGTRSGLWPAEWAPMS